MLKEDLDCQHGWVGGVYVASYYCCHTWNHTLGILIQEIPFLGTLAQIADEHNELEFAVWQNTHLSLSSWWNFEEQLAKIVMFLMLFSCRLRDWVFYSLHGNVHRCNWFLHFQTWGGQPVLLCPRMQGVIWYSQGLMGTNSFNLCNLHFKTDSELQVLL